jgi:hypothetical protein
MGIGSPLNPATILARLTKLEGDLLSIPSIDTTLAPRILDLEREVGIGTGETAGYADVLGRLDSLENKDAELVADITGVENLANSTDRRLIALDERVADIEQADLGNLINSTDRRLVALDTRVNDFEKAHLENLFKIMTWC